MAEESIAVIGGVDTHTDLHQPAAVDTIGRYVAIESFPHHPAGYRALLAWLRSHGGLIGVGVEGSGSYGAELARHLRTAGVAVVGCRLPRR